MRTYTFFVRLFITMTIFILYSNCSEFSQSNIELTINSETIIYRIPVPGSDYIADKGEVYLVLSLTVKNIGKRKFHTNPLYITIADQSGRIYSYAGESCWLDKYFDSIDLQPGTNYGGVLAFKVPESIKSFKLYYDDEQGNRITKNLKDAGKPEKKKSKLVEETKKSVDKGVITRKILAKEFEKTYSDVGIRVEACGHDNKYLMFIHPMFASEDFRNGWVGEKEVMTMYKNAGFIRLYLADGQSSWYYIISDYAE